MELTSEEKNMLRRIANNPYSGGAYKRATWIDMVCHSEADKAVLRRSLLQIRISRAELPVR